MQLSRLQRTCDHRGPRVTRAAAAAAAAAVHKLPQTQGKRGIQEADLLPDLLSCDAEQPESGCACASERSVSFLTLGEDPWSLCISSRPMMFTARHVPSLTF